MPGAARDLAVENMAAAIDREAQLHHAFFTARLRVAGIALVLLKVAHQSGLP
jgi:hypothetical protein